MPCDKSLFSFLPWRKRRDNIKDDDNLESMELRQEEEEHQTSADSNAQANVRVKYTGKYRKTEGSSSLHFLSMVMRSSTFLQDRTSTELVKLIYQGNTDGLFSYLSGLTKTQISKLKIAGQTILHLLCLREDLNALKIALSLGTDANVVNDDGVSPLHVAVNEGWTEGVKELILGGASANLLPEASRSSSWPFQEIPVLTAARNGDCPTALLLLDQGPNLRLTDPERNTILHLACYSHCFELIERLLEEKSILVDISASNNKGNSPLHCLMLSNNMTEDEEIIAECVELLLQNGADVNHLNAGHKSCLFLAARANLPKVVTCLLESGADPTIKSRDGKCVIHAACRSSNNESLEVLLKSDRASKLLFSEDEFGYSPFHVAVGSGSINCCETLIKYGDHLSRIDSLGRSRCSLVLKNMPPPSALRLLKKVFDSGVEISDHDQNDTDFHIKLDFSYILSRSNEDVEASLISDIYSTDAESLLKHPLIESFLYLKWHKIRLFFYLYVLLYFLFLVIHTFYIFKTYNMKTDWTKEVELLQMVHVTHIIMVIALMIPSTITIFANIKKYFKQWETYFKVVALSTAAFVVFAREAAFRDEEIERNVAAVSIFFAWVEFMMLLGRFPSLGVYILMFTRVAKSIIGFLLAFSSLLIAFTLSFGILFNKIEVFQSFPIAFVKTLMMMIGEIDYVDIYEQSKSETNITMVVSQIFLVVFLFLIPVLMANLLIGLAVNDLPDLQYHSKVRRLVKEASYLESYERVLLIVKEFTCIPVSLLNLFAGKGSIKRSIVVYPNHRGKYGMKSTVIPDDAIESSIEIGSQWLTSKENVDIKVMLKEFVDNYNADKRNNEATLETLLQAVSQLKCSTKEDLDKVRRRKKSLINRKYLC